MEQSQQKDWPASCPAVPLQEGDIDFRREPMVDWLAPRQLANTGLQAAMAAVFGAYADKREVQAALNPLSDDDKKLFEDYSQSGEPFWLDYGADTGDGFDATYAMAWLMSRPELRVGAHADEATTAGEPVELPRGRMLILGGDQVYPTATREEYQNRFRGPFRAAYPWQDPELGEHPHLYAIPGNHDWYDGLTSFTRLFCQQRWVGAWHTQQKRSYFALRLPHGWWLWGTDIQLQADIDKPQLDYFQKVAERMNALAEQEGSGRPKLILCTAQPQWVYCDPMTPQDPDAERGSCRLECKPEQFDSLAYFHRELISANHIDLKAILSGDLHHYTHYERSSDATESVEMPTHLVTAGGAGAYLYPTHHMPATLRVPFSRKRDETQVDPVPVEYQQRAVYPRAASSRRLGRWSWVALPWRNFGFASLLAFIYLVFTWMVQSASRSINGIYDYWPTDPGEDKPNSLLTLLSRIDEVSLDAFLSIVRAFAEVLRYSPGSCVLALCVVVGLWQFRQSAGSTTFYGLSGVLHGLAHLLLAFVLICGLAILNLHSPLTTMLEGWNLPWGGWRTEHPFHVALFFGQMLLLGGLCGGWLFGLYLMLTSRFSGAHMNEVFSSQSLPDYKNFLRLRIDPPAEGETTGRVTVYSVGVPAVPRSWDFCGEKAGPGEAWYAPPEGRIATELIEEPYTLD